jgi:hypothetical protein
MSGLLLEGTLFGKRLTAPQNTGFVPMGNTIKLEITAESETVERISKQMGTYGAALDSIVIPKPQKLTMGSDELGSRENLAMALLGTDTNLSVTGAAVSNEVVTVKLNEWIPLAHSYVAETPAPVVKDSTGVTTYTVNTDYVIDSHLGMIKAVSGGAIADAASLKVSYTYKSQSGFKITGGTNALIKFELKLRGRNLANDELVVFHAYRVPFAPSGAIDLLGKEFISIESSGPMEIPEGKNEPYTIEAVTTS